MRNLYFWLGIFFMFFGFLGGHRFIASYFSWPAFNCVTKDQVTCIFGIVFMLIGAKTK